MRTYHQALLFSVLTASLLFVGNGYPADQPAGEPGEKLKSLLSHLTEHYSAKGDSLKLAAARFLIDNMEGHGYATYELRDTSSAMIAFDVLSFPDYAALEQGFDSLEERYGVLDFEKREMIEDVNVMTPEFLVANIDAAFTAWNERPWARNLSFNDFLEYVLPYRGSNEPLESWREPLMERYDSLFNRMKNSSDPVEAAVLINQDLMQWFHFDPRFYYHPTDQGYSEMLATKLGRCEDMTNLTIFAFRANGLAVTSDYTPYWANSGNNHAWNAIVTPEGDVIPFMGAEANPGEYRLANKVAKVYRKMYSRQPENLAFLVDDPEKVPRYLASKSYTDVTADYTDVNDVSVCLNFGVADSIEFAYLCVFNSGEWQPIQWGKIAGDSIIFKAMGIDVAYLPGFYVNEKIIPAGDPFILGEDGTKRDLVADTLNLEELVLTSTTKVRQEESTDSFGRSQLEPEKNYELFVWNAGWVSVSTIEADTSALVFESVPASGLYWLVAEGSDREERIFTYEGGRQVWW